MLKRIYARIRAFWWAAPFLLIALLFVLFLDSRIPDLPSSLEARGQFGDSFGVLNSLFTGLGFAGLLITIGLQQRQLAQQARDFQAQLQDAAARKYEENLYRLLALYHEALHSVISTRDNQTSRGRDVLQVEIEGLLKSIRRDHVNSVPHQLQKRYRAGTLNEQDRHALDFLYYRNFWHLNNRLIRQGRLIESLKALLRHLEDNAPSAVERGAYRSIVQSQITHIELSYLLYVALGYTAESELRDLLVRSTLIKRASSVFRLKVHRIMYFEYWGHDLSVDRQARSLPMAQARINFLIKRESAIRSNLKKATTVD